MKILQVISYGYLAGGAEKSVSLLKQELRSRGHEVMVLASDHNKDGSEVRFSDLEFPEIDKPGVSLLTKSIKHLWYRPSHRTIKATIARFKPDVVHFHIMGQLSPSAIFALGKVPGILTVHGPEEYVTGILEWGFPKHLFKNERVTRSNLTTVGKAYYAYFKYVQRPLYAMGFRRHIRVMLAPSKYMATLLSKENYGVPLRQLYNGIALPKPHFLQRRNRLLYVGRLEHVKGVDVLLRAMPQIVKCIPGAHLSIVGDGAMRPQLEEFTRRNRLQKHVTFFGWLRPEKVNEHYKQTTIVVIPSVWPENLPTVCIEALAMGRPVIGTHSGGIPELIQDGITGRIVALGDENELAAAAVELLSRPDLPAMAELCAASMQDFKITAFIRKLERLYYDIAEAVKEKV